MDLPFVKKDMTHIKDVYKEISLIYVCVIGNFSTFYAIKIEIWTCLHMCSHGAGVSG